jgi:hypothetical protein
MLIEVGQEQRHHEKARYAVSDTMQAFQQMPTWSTELRNPALDPRDDRSITKDQGEAMNSRRARRARRGHEKGETYDEEGTEVRSECG